MEPTTTVFLVRHGQVDNPRRVLYGRLPGFVLSAKGRRQADLLGRYFAGADVAAVRSSPLERARETAAAIAGPLGLDPDVDDRLIEASNVFEGATGNVALWVLRHPSTLGALRDWRTPSWGEPHVQLAGRMRAAIDDARTRFAGSRVVLVSHQAPIWAARRSFERHGLAHLPHQRQCALASVTTLEFAAAGTVRIRYREPAAHA